MLAIASYSKWALILELKNTGNKKEIVFISFIGQRYWCPAGVFGDQLWLANQPRELYS